MNNDDTRFNGWTNHATWSAALWLGNDYEVTKRAEAMIREMQERHVEKSQSAQDNKTIDLCCIIYPKPLQEWSIGSGPSLHPACRVAFTSCLTQAEPS